jgi:hypothetical protein
MYKKSILSVVIASAFTLGGCSSSNDTSTGSTPLPSSPEEAGTGNPYEGGVYARFNLGHSEIPVPSDLMIQKDQPNTAALEQSDGTYAVPNFAAKQLAGTLTPPEVALENLSGASLTAPIDIEMSGAIDPTSVDGRAFIISGASVIPNPNQSVFLIELDYASQSPLSALSVGEPPTIPLAVTAQSAIGGDLTAGAQLLALANSPAYSAEVITRNKLVNGTPTETTYIRINPLRPLSPNKRYIVALTTDIQDTEGNPVTRSPGVTGYDVLTDADQPLASAALGAARSLINLLWEGVTTSYFGLTNSGREQDLTVDNIVMSYSFTTSNDTKVLDYIVEPNTWITATLERMVREGARAAAMAGGASDYTAVKATIDGAYGAWVATSISDTLAPLMAALCPIGTYPAGAAQFACAGSALQGYMTNPAGPMGLGLTLPNPKADTTIDFGSTQRDVRSVSSLITDSIATVGTVNIAEATLSIPYYLGVPTARGTDPDDDSELNLVEEWWRADSTIATVLDGALRTPGSTIPLIPQASTTGTDYAQSDVINAFYPFPRKRSNEEIPVLAVYPADDTNKPAEGYKTIIYQHGITTDRSVALTLGSAIVANSGGTVAVIAIDQALHGVDHATTLDQQKLAETLLTSGGILTADGSFDGAHETGQATIDAVVGGVFNVGVLQQIQAAPCPALAGLDLSDPADIATAATNVNDGNCGPTAQASYFGATTMENTVANAASQIPGLAGSRENERHFGFGGVNLVPLPIDFDDGTSLIGTFSAGTGSGSMTINVGSFLTSRDNFRQQVLDLMTLRLSLANMDLDDDGTPDLNTNDVHFIGHSLGTLNGIPFVEIANSTASTADDIVSATFLTPGGNIARLTENSPAFAPRVMLGLASAASINRGDTNFEAFLNILQATLDAFDPINFVGNLKTTVADTRALMIQSGTDFFIPNEADPAADITQPATLNLLTINDQSTGTINDDTVTLTSVANPQAGVSFGEGTDAPLAGTEPLATISGATSFDSTVADTATDKVFFARFDASSGFLHTTPVFPASPSEVASYGEIVGQVTSFVMSDGASILVTDDTLLEAAP